MRSSGARVATQPGPGPRAGGTTPGRIAGRGVRQRQQRQARSPAERIDGDGYRDDGDELDVSRLAEAAGQQAPVPGFANPAGSLQMRWIASIAGGGNDAETIRCAPAAASGDSDAARSAHKGQAAAARVSAAMASRSAPVHQVPGAPKSRHATV